MEYTLLDTLTFDTTDCLVIGLLKDAPLNPEQQSLDATLDGLISRLKLKLQNPGDFRLQSDVNGKALLLVLFGNDYKPLHSALNTVLSQKFTTATFAIPLLKNSTCSQQLSFRQGANERTEGVYKQYCTSSGERVYNTAESSSAKSIADQQLEQMIQHIDAGCYTLHQFKSEPKPQALKHISLVLPQASQQALAQGVALAKSITFTKTLADLPANVCTPTYLAQQAQDLAGTFEAVECKVFQQKDLEQLKMGALLAVAQGSVEPPCLIEIKYQGQTTQAPIVLVGKGVTFDAGGISLKPASNMHEMKYDMAGAATVLGVIQACALLKLPVHVIGLIPSAENLPSGTAIKPGDIIRSMSQQTIEILNTDAEGRLLLADALTYAERFKPQYVIDIATLTGAVIVALGHINSGLMSPDDELSEQLLQAAKRAQDKLWRLPLDPEYDCALDSPMADMINANFDRSAGSITAGMFLSKFTKAYRWAHLDIAGTAWVSGKQRAATGRPVPLLVEFLRHVAKS